MRVALISDPHIDVANRFDETLRVLHWIADDIKHRCVDVVAVGGDMVERRPTPSDTLAVCQWNLHLAETAEVVGVLGNHDPDLSLGWLPCLRGDHPISFYDKPAIHTINGVVEIACMPWPRRASALNGNESADSLRAVLQGLGASFATPGPRLFLGHVNVVGARMNSGQPLAPANGVDVSLSDLALVGAHAYLLGHIHLGQSFPMVGNAPCFYPGSPRRVGYGEPEAKSYAIVDVDDQTGAATVEYIETPCQRMILLEATWAPELGALDFPVPCQLDGAVGADVRVRYSVAKEHREAATKAANEFCDKLRAIGVARAKPELVTVASTRARTPEVSTARTLPDKVQALWRAKNDVPAPARAQRLIGKLGELEVSS